MIEKITKLYEEIEKLHIFIIRVNTFLREVGTNYQFKESLKALRSIIKILEEKVKTYEEKREEFEKLLRERQTNCSHEVVITDNLNTKCALCDKLITKMPETTNIQIIIDDDSSPYVGFYNVKYKYIFELANSKIHNMLCEIYDIINNSKEDYEEVLENWQYEKNIKENDIKIRRLIK